MDKSEINTMLRSLRTILRAGPDDKFRARLRGAIEAILADQMSITELPTYLGPILRRLTVSYQQSGQSVPLRAAVDLLRLR